MRAQGLDKSPNAPLATIAKINNAQRLAAVDARGAVLGLKPGTSLPDARVMHPTLICADADPAAEAQTLAHIADWCRRFTPLAALDAPDGVMLDVSGAAHLFGGEAGLLAEIEARLGAQGFDSQAALASTPEAAWALARYGNIRILPPDLDEKDLSHRLANLPLAALRLDAMTIKALAQAGLRRIGDIMMRPRAPIAARCGTYLYARLDGLLARAKNPISPRFEAPAFLAERRFLDGISRREDIEATIFSLADDLSTLLTRHGEGARRLEVSLFRVDGLVKHFEVGTSRPLREPGLIAKLFRERIEAIGAVNDDDPFDAGYGFDVIRLSALAVERKDPEQIGWTDPNDGADLADLIDRLGARLGLQRITRLSFNPTNIPEFAVIATPAAHLRETALTEARSFRIRRQTQATPRELHAFPVAPSTLDEEASAKHLPSRPIRLLQQPEPIEAIAEAPNGPPLRFRWRRVLHEVAALEGPERIAAEWWRSETALTRDYFRAEDTEGQRFWLFREGLFTSETAQPRWFMHGFFA
jgi:protein ImuB